MQRLMGSMGVIYRLLLTQSITIDNPTFNEKIRQFMMRMRPSYQYLISKGCLNYAGEVMRCEAFFQVDN
jgi:hypothetical protein